ncbi:hypothetical protein FKM82_021783 [Ascaphus truei]
MTCAGPNMTVSVDKNLLEYLRYNPAASYLSSDPGCTGASITTLSGKRMYSLTVSTITGRCGNKMSTNSSHVTYSNMLHIPASTSSGIVSVNNISLNISCSYALNMQTSLATVLHPVMSTENLTVESSGIEGAATIAAYINPTYTSPLQQEQQDQLTVGSTLYFGMSVQFPDPIFVLRVERCFATPNNDPNDPIQVELIRGGCSIGEGPYVKLDANGEATEVRFSIVSFAFQGHNNVYIFCNARMCNNVTSVCTGCTTSRAAIDGTKQFSLGPFGFIDNEEANSSSHTALSGAVLWGSLLGLLGLWIL